MKAPIQYGALFAELSENGYSNLRILPTGEVVGTMPMCFTVGLFVGLDETSYRTRFCYPREFAADAVHAAESWGGSGDPPGRWIKEKGRGGDRTNPRSAS